MEIRTSVTLKKGKLKLKLAVTLKMSENSSLKSGITLRINHVAQLKHIKFTSYIGQMIWTSLKHLSSSVPTIWETQINLISVCIRTVPWGKIRFTNIFQLMKANCEALNDGRKLTNQSIRKLLLQKCNDIGLAPTAAVQISGHKNLQSVNSYSNKNKMQQP